METNHFDEDELYLVWENWQFFVSFYSSDKW
jgi:hypothetical protein